MILNLYIENIAVIEKTSIDFSDGFNVMTGETGAGKSIVIDSINLILGHRAQRDIIRTGSERAFISATFDSLSSEVTELIENLGYSIDEDGLLIIQREINLNGKGTCRINSRPATVASLKQIGKYLINIHGQHESYGLLSPDTHLEYVDNLGGLNIDLENYRSEFNELRKLKLNLDEGSIDESEKARKLDLLKYQINEIEEINPIRGEEEELKEQREIFMNSEKISSSISKSKELIKGDETNIGALQLLESATNSILEVSPYISTANDLYSRMKNLVYELEDCASEIINMSDDVEYDSDEMEKIELRLDDIYKLTRKYGSNIDEVLEYLKKAKDELENIEFFEEKIEKLKVLFKECKLRTIKLADILSKRRKQVADIFAKNVKEELEFLAMPGVKFCISIKKGNLNINGFDEIEFLISTNPGEDPKPISKIASGGELSRIMLAIKSVSADNDRIDSLIFDEIDTGISGAVAQKVGIKLKEVSKKRQVICVTHSAQIASLSDIHFLISKSVKNNRTYTSIKKLDLDGRKKEIARIIGGEKITDTTLANASEMIEMGQCK